MFPLRVLPVRAPASGKHLVASALTVPCPPGFRILGPIGFTSYSCKSPVNFALCFRLFRLTKAVIDPSKLVVGSRLFGI